MPPQSIRLTNQLIAIHAVTSVAVMSSDQDTMLEATLLVAMDVVDAQAGAVSLMNTTTGKLDLRARRNRDPDVQGTPLNLTDEMFESVLAADDVVVSDEIALAPMHSRGQIVGILGILSREHDGFDVDTVSVLRVLADTVGVALENNRLYTESRANANRMAAILDSSADGIIATDDNARITLINSTAERMLGVKQADLVGVSLREAPISIRASLVKVLESRELDNMFKITLENQRVVAVLASPIAGSDDEGSDGWVVVLQDVTHHREEQIARAQFVRAAAHDMRNPLSVTTNALVILTRMLDNVTPEIQEIIDLAMGGVHRIRAMIEDVLALEQLESGHRFTLEATVLTDVLRESAMDVVGLIGERSYEFREDIPDDLPHIQADANWLKRAILNYLDNAFKYSPDGAVVTLRAYVDDKGVHIEVSDNGPGIPVSAQPRLFERFYRVREQTDIEGTGLGLAIVETVARAHGGSVTVHSVPGEGSTFGIVLPV